MAGGKTPSSYERSKKQATVTDIATTQDSVSSSTPPSKRPATNGAITNSTGLVLRLQSHKKRVEPKPRRLQPLCLVGCLIPGKTAEVCVGLIKFTRLVS